MTLLFIKNFEENDMQNSFLKRLNKKRKITIVITSCFLVEKKEKHHIDFTKKQDSLLLVYE